MKANSVLNLPLQKGLCLAAVRRIGLRCLQPERGSGLGAGSFSCVPTAAPIASASSPAITPCAAGMARPVPVPCSRAQHHGPGHGLQWSGEGCTGVQAVPQTGSQTPTRLVAGSAALGRSRRSSLSQGLGKPD